MDDYRFPADRDQRDGTADDCTGSVIRGTDAVGAAIIEPFSGGNASRSTAERAAACGRHARTQPCPSTHHHGPGG